MIIYPPLIPLCNTKTSSTKEDFFFFNHVERDAKSENNVVRIIFLENFTTATAFCGRCPHDDVGLPFWQHTLNGVNSYINLKFSTDYVICVIILQEVNYIHVFSSL